MPTKLKKPITVEITHVANAVWLMMYLRDANPIPTHPNAEAIAMGPSIAWQNTDNSCRSQIARQLKEQGIDFETWLPETPLTIGGHEVVYNPDGSAKIGCTTVSAKEIEEFLKRRPASEWPKYFIGGFTGRLWRASNADDSGSVFQQNQWSAQGGKFLCEVAKKDAWKQITRAEAAAITGEKNL